MTRTWVLLCLLGAAVPAHAQADDETAAPPLQATLRNALVKDAPEDVYKKHRVEMGAKEVELGPVTVARRSSFLATLMGRLVLNPQVRTYLEASPRASKELPGDVSNVANAVLSWTTTFCVAMWMAGWLMVLPAAGIVVLGLAVALLYAPAGVAIALVGAWLGLTGGLAGVFFLVMGFPAAVVQIIHNLWIIRAEEHAAEVFNLELQRRIDRLALEPPATAAPQRVPPPAPTVPSAQEADVRVTDPWQCLNAEALQRELTTVSGPAAAGLVLTVSVEAPSPGTRRMVLNAEGRNSPAWTRTLEIPQDECVDAPRVVARMVGRQLEGASH